MPTLTTTDDIDLYYEYTDPDDDRPTVVFLNGMTQSTRHWETQVDTLEDRFGALTWDARGQGRSEVGDTELTMDRHTADLAAILDDIGVDHAHLVGFSHGARIALCFAADYPDRLDRLVVCSATAEETARARIIVRSWRETLEHGGLEAMTWTALPTILGNKYLEQHESIVEGIVRASVRRASEEGIRRLVEALPDYPDPADMAEQVQAPTLVLSGSDDPLVEAEGARKLAELAGGEHDEFEDVGHTLPIEVPQQFHKRIAEFLER